MGKGGKRVGSGRTLVPTEKKILEGRFRKDRHGDAPPVVGGFPRPPDGLSPSEAELWAWFPKAPWIGETDVLAVQAAVCIYERILRTQREGGSIDQEQKLWGRLLSILGCLGMTPADRGKMSAPKIHEQEDKWAGIL